MNLTHSHNRSVSLFRRDFPAAWLFHQNTVRWPFNTVEPEDEPWAEPSFKEYSNVASIVLPEMQELRLPLGDAIRRRLSCRNFASEPLSLEELSTVLGAGYGVQSVVHLGAMEHLERPVPSGGGLYPLEMYLIVRHVEGLPSGLYHYFALTHALDEIKRIEFSSALISQLFMNQPYVYDAAVILLLTAVVERSMHKYEDRGYRYMLLEAGHVTQNMCLAVACLELGALPIGGFFDGYLTQLLDLDIDKETLLYGLAIGRAASTDRAEARNLGALYDR